MKKTKILILLAICSMFTGALTGCNKKNKVSNNQVSSSVSQISNSSSEMNTISLDSITSVASVLSETPVSSEVPVSSATSILSEPSVLSEVPSSEATSSLSSSFSSEEHIHTWALVAAQNPQCNEDGYSAHYECECGAWSIDGTDKGINEHSYWQAGAYYAVIESVDFQKSTGIFAKMHLVYGSIHMSSNSAPEIVVHSMKSSGSIEQKDQDATIKALYSSSSLNEITTVNPATGSFIALIQGIDNLYDLPTANGVIITPKGYDTELCKCSNSAHVCEKCNSYYGLSIDSESNRGYYSLANGENQYIYILTPELKKDVKYYFINKYTSNISINKISFAKLGSNSYTNGKSTSSDYEKSFTPWADGKYQVSINLDSAYNFNVPIAIDIVTNDKTQVSIISNGDGVPDNAPENLYYVNSSLSLDVTDPELSSLCKMYITRGDTSYTIWSGDNDYASWLVPYLYKQFEWGVTDVTVTLAANISGTWYDAFQYKFDEMCSQYNIEDTGECSITLSPVLNTLTIGKLFSSDGKWIYSGSSVQLKAKVTIASLSK